MYLKRFIAGVLLLASIVAGKAHAQGIDFQHISFEEALVLAKQQNKLIFIDFYTAWCGPCKQLAKGPFMDPEIGKFYNKHFINLKLDAEKEGKQAAALFAVHRYPTLLFVDGDSKLVYRGTGSTMKKSGGMIPFSKLALEATKDKMSLEDMQQLFPEKQDDEAFLKSYYNRLVEYNMNPIDVLDAWLTVQTELEESSAEMIDILLKHTNQIYLGSKAETVLRANYDHYLTIVSRQNKIRLERIEGFIINATLNRAYSTNDPVLMRRYIDHCKEKNIGPAKRGKLSFYEMEYLRIAKEYDAYKRAAEAYIDGIIGEKSLKQIKQEDVNLYNKYLEYNKEQSGAYHDFKIRLLKQGKIATNKVEEIVKVSRVYWSHCNTKEDFRHLKSWIKYCDKLIPEYWEVNNLEADILYKQGKRDKAIALKEVAIENAPFNYKKKTNLEYQLQLMRQAKELTLGM
ncbi:thioredoxin family protein [Carboxylicivirga sp. A043]|uniref:thioredoxin family protein n=1 Tax=Carboxylicivirga litoralis TaxID=2816963 RepID=UPI0021CB029B|nr:thioredoxin family protein [Carboxylicivirga sp. A043]MCU4155849.1 thioredoxin family protein [Carboxylicivirga sp. A043]